MKRYSPRMIYCSSGVEAGMDSIEDGKYVLFSDHEQEIKKQKEECLKFLADIKEIVSMFNCTLRNKDLYDQIDAEIKRLSEGK